MPELPEVETIARRLRDGAGPGSPSLVGMKISESRLFWRRTLASPTPREFHSRIAGQQVKEVRRRGKFIVVDLRSGALLLHLRMGGALEILPAGTPRSPHCRLELDLGPRWRLVFCNPRKFGRVWLVADPEEALGDLGPEPLSPEFTFVRFSDLLEERRRQIKPLLLDQRVIAGLGNIYADESLHRAGIHPLARADRLSMERRRKLWRAIRAVLREAIQHEGTTFDSAYNGGAFLPRLRVYQRTGAPCRKCGRPIERMLVGQRSSHFCPTCQRK